MSHGGDYQTCRWVSYAEKVRAPGSAAQAIAEAHPEYGYRRATTELRERYGRRVNRQVVGRLHRLRDLPLRRLASKAERHTVSRRRLRERGRTRCRDATRRRSERSRSSTRISLNSASLAAFGSQS